MTKSDCTLEKLEFRLTILSLLITEVLSDSQTSKGDTSTGSWGLVHLTENQGDLGFTIKLDDTSLLHFVVQIVTLTSTLTDTSEDGVTTVSLGDVVLHVVSGGRGSLICPCPYNELLNEHSLSDTCTTKETNLSTTCVRGKQVDDLDTGDKNFGRCGLLDELWWVCVNGSLLVVLDRSTLVDGVTSHVHDTTKSAWADRNHDRVAAVSRNLTTGQTLGTWKHASDLGLCDTSSFSLPSIAIHLTTFSPKCCC